MPARFASGLRLAVSVLLGCDARAEPSVPGEVDCFERRESVAYLLAVQDEVLKWWNVPIDTASDQTVVVNLRLAEDGSLTSYELVAWSTRSMAAQIGYALLYAAPFEPMPRAARCLAGRRIRTTFRTPVD